MPSSKYTGIRKINFKDFFTETTGAGYPALWEGPSSTGWSVGIGAGSLPSVWKGWGYRMLVSGEGTHRTYAKTPPPWGTLSQVIAGRKRQLQFDFMFRINGSVQGDGIAFEFMVLHSGTPLWTVSKGYRVRIDGSTVYLEKIDTGGGIPAWATFVDATPSPSTTPFIPNPDMDYFVRVTYFPEDIDIYTGYSISSAGIFLVSITDDKDKIGQGDILQFDFQDASPMTGSANDTIGFEVFSDNNVEFDGVTYSDGFIDKPQYMHYIASMHEIGQTLNLKFNPASEEVWDWLETGDRVELWLKERRMTVTGPPYALTDTFYTFCKMDGRVKMVKDKDNEGLAHVLVRDEMRVSLISDKGHQNPLAADVNYYNYLIRVFLAEYQGQTGKRTRLCVFPGWSATGWNVAVSANWTMKGNFYEAFRTFSLIVNAWYYWLPAGIMVSQLTAIPTAKKFDTVAMSGDIQWIQGVVLSDEKEQGYHNRVDQYHDNGAGVVTLTSVANAADITNYGPSVDERVDITVPPAEGVLMANNRYSQQNDKNPIVDILCPFYGVDFHVGCLVGINAPEKGIDDEDNYIIIEEEIIHTDMGTDQDIKGYHRFRLAYQDNDQGAYNMPREEIRPMGELLEWRTKQDYHSALLT